MDYFSELLNSYNLLKKRKLKLVEEKVKDKEEEKKISVSNLPAQVAGKGAGKQTPTKPKAAKAPKPTEKKPSKELTPDLPVPGESLKKEPKEGEEEITSTETPEDGGRLRRRNLDLIADVGYQPEDLMVGQNLQSFWVDRQMDPESDESKVYGLIRSQYDSDLYYTDVSKKKAEGRKVFFDDQGKPIPEWVAKPVSLPPKLGGQSYQSVQRHIFKPGSGQPGSLHKSIETAQIIVPLGEEGEFFDIKPLKKAEGLETVEERNYRMRLEGAILKNFDRLSTLLVGFSKKRRLSLDDAQWLTNTFKYYTIDDKFDGVIVDTGLGVTLKFSDSNQFLTSMLQASDKMLTESEITSADYPQDQIKGLFKGLGRLDRNDMAAKAMKYKQSRIGTIIEEITPFLKSMIRPAEGVNREEIAASLVKVLKKNIDQMRGFLQQFQQAEDLEAALDADALPVIEFIKDFIKRDENGDFEIAKIVSRLMMNIKKDRFYKAGQQTLSLGKNVGLGKRADHGHVFMSEEELLQQLGPNALQENEVYIGSFDGFVRLGYGKNLDEDSIPGQVDPATGKKRIIVALNSLKTPQRGADGSTTLGSGSMDQVRKVMSNDPSLGQPGEAEVWRQQIVRYSGLTAEKYLEIDHFYREGIRSGINSLTRVPRARITRSGQTPIEEKPVAQDTTKLLISYFDRELSFAQKYDQKTFSAASYARLKQLQKELSARKGFELDKFITDNELVLEGIERGIAYSVMTRNLRNDLQDRNNPNYERAISYMKANIFSFGGLAQDKMNTHINPTHEDVAYEIRQNQILKDAFDGLSGDNPTWTAEITESGTWILRNNKNKKQTISCYVEKSYSQGKKDNYNEWVVELSGDLVRAYNRRHLQPTIQTEQTEISSMIEEFLENQRKILEALTHKVGIR